MRKTFVPALAVAVVTLAGCGSSHSSSSTHSGTTARTSISTSTTASAATPRATSVLSSLTSVRRVASTVPANGDANPYGIAMVPQTVGKLRAGDLLISNYNDKANNQGTGTTVDQISPGGKVSVFADISSRALPGSCPGGVGLTTALAVIAGQWVVVGSLPTTNGKSATAKAGCLIVLDRTGRPVSTIAGSKIQGPWDMTAVGRGSQTSLFVSNALNGGAANGIHTIKNSTVVRIELRTNASAAPKVISEQVIGDRIPWRDDPAALVIGPTGVALAPSGTLYVADTLDNRITAIPQAMTRTKPAPGGGTAVAQGKHLNQPLGLLIAPNGDILTTNAGDGKIVETTPSGQQVATRTADTKTGAGSLFGLVMAPGGHGLYYVDDGDNTLRLLR